MAFYPRASLARTVFSFKTFFDPRYRPPTPVLVKVKSEKSESIFGPLNFFVFRYVEGGVLGNNYISIKKCRTTFLWVLNFGEVGEIFKNFKNHTATVTFWKIFSKVWFWKNFTRDFPVKNEENFFSDPQLVQNLTPIRILLSTFLYLCCCYLRPPL